MINRGHWTFKKLVFVMVGLLALPSWLISADWKLFIPAPTDNGAVLEGFGSYESDDNRVGLFHSKWTDLFFREKFTLFSDGFIYHPKFLQYRFALGGILKQEDFKFLPQTAGNWNNNTGLEYNAQFYLLPDHHYNLDLFARRLEPMYKEKSAVQHDNVETSRGVLFRYRNKPYFLHARYIFDSSSSSLFTTDINEFGLDAEYFKEMSNGRHWSVTGSAVPKSFSTNTGLSGDSRDYSLVNEFFMHHWNLYSSLTKSTLDQESATTGSFGSDQLLWIERFRYYLPAGFETDFYNRYQDNSNEVGGEPSGETSLIKEKNNLAEAELIHRLFKSLENIYTYRDTRTDTTGGKLTDISHSLVTNYNKTIPKGTLLAGFNIGRATTDSKGGPSVVDERHDNTAVPGSFVLADPYADPQSIQVFLRSPIAPFETIPLVENVHYTVTPVGNTFQVFVLTLPPQFVVPGTFNLFATYSVIAGKYKLRTDTLGFNTSVDLFRNLLTPYYSYNRLRSDVLSGVFPGEALRSDQHTVGLLVHKGPVRVTTEYQNLNWNVSPYRAWRAEVDYVDSLDGALNIYLTGAYLNRRFTSGTAISPFVPYTEQTESASGNIQKPLFRKQLLLSAGGSYSRIEGLSEGNGYSVNSTLTWKVGKLDFTLGAVRYWSDTQIAATVSQERGHEYIYFNVRRELF